MSLIKILIFFKHCMIVYLLIWKLKKGSDFMLCSIYGNNLNITLICSFIYVVFQIKEVIYMVKNKFKKHISNIVSNFIC